MIDNYIAIYSLNQDDEIDSKLKIDTAAINLKDSDKKILFYDFN